MYPGINTDHMTLRGKILCVFRNTRVIVLFVPIYTTTLMLLLLMLMVSTKELIENIELTGYQSRA
jgi:hypothetical protein